MKLREMNEILMRAQIPVFYQFRDGNHLVNIAAELLIPLPFIEIRIIGRGSGQGKRLLRFQMLVEIGQRFPPFFSQMVRLVKTKERYFGRFENADDIFGLVHPEPTGSGDGVFFFRPLVIFRAIVFRVLVKPAKRGQQGLIGNDGDVTRFTDIG